MIGFLKRRRQLSCDEVMEVLQSYLDGEVDAEAARKVAAHLEDCTDCDLESSVYRNIKASLAHVEREPVDPTVLESLRNYGERVSRGLID